MKPRLQPARPIVGRAPRNTRSEIRENNRANLETIVEKKTHTKRQYTRGPRNTDSEKTTTALLEPENVIEVAEPGTSGETVNQTKLRKFYELQTEFFDLRDRYAAAYSQIQDLIIKGANISQGQYKVKYGVQLVRRPRYKQVVIDLKGEAYQQRVLENTHPHAHFRVRVG